MIQKPEKIYNQIGVNYNLTRSADPGILKMTEKLLDCSKNSTLIDIGAGTGNYSCELARKGYVVHAVEPSELMVKQKKNHRNLKWYYGVAENLSFRENVYQGAVITLAIHHFRSIPDALAEVYRVLKKKARLVIFTADPDLAQSDNWLKKYFNQLFPIAFRAYPKKDYLETILKNIFKSNPEIFTFHLPDNLKDGFFFSAWKYPERYLDKGFRNGISVFTKSGENIYLPLLKRLKKDLGNGVWEKKYGYVRNLKMFDGGYFFMSVQKN